MTALPNEGMDSESLTQLLNIYKDAEVVILQQIAKQVTAGKDVPDWEQKKLQELQALQARVRNMLSGIVGRSLRLINESITQAYNQGNYEALADLSQEAIQRSLTLSGMARASSLTALVQQAQAGVLGTHLMALRSTEDIYRRVIQQAAITTTTGTMTRRQAAQIALNRFASSGVAVYKDGAGRNWSMSSYTEMAMRTATHRASSSGKVDQWQARGKDLVYVSDHGQECELCRPWEGKILSIGGSGNPLAVATLETAQAAGLMHPNCRHTVDLYVDGLTEIPKAVADPEGDADRQKLRAMERTTRKWQTRKAVAVTPQAYAQADAKVKTWKATIKEHVATTSAKRLPYREGNNQAR